jgi:hypothetical protein
VRSRLAAVALVVLAVAQPSGARAQAAVVLDSSGARLGVYAGPAFASDSEREGFLVVSSTGFAAIFDEVTGAHASLPRAGHVNRPLGPIRFAGPGCTGTTYVRVEFGGIPIVGGFVFRSRNTVYYAPTGVVSSQTATQSTIDDNGNCASVTVTEELIQVAPNDPAVTGFSSNGYTGPLRLGFLPRDLFADSFELAS